MAVDGLVERLEDVLELLEGEVAALLFVEKLKNVPNALLVMPLREEKDGLLHELIKSDAVGVARLLFYLSHPAHHCVEGRYLDVEAQLLVDALEVRGVQLEFDHGAAGLVTRQVFVEAVLEEFERLITQLNAGKLLLLAKTRVYFVRHARSVEPVVMGLVVEVGCQLDFLDVALIVPFLNLAHVRLLTLRQIAKLVLVHRVLLLEVIVGLADGDAARGAVVRILLHFLLFYKNLYLNSMKKMGLF